MVCVAYETLRVILKSTVSVACKTLRAILRCTVHFLRSLKGAKVDRDFAILGTFGARRTVSLQGGHLLYFFIVVVPDHFSVI